MSGLDEPLRDKNIYALRAFLTSRGSKTLWLLNAANFSCWKIVARVAFIVSDFPAFFKLLLANNALSF